MQTVDRVWRYPSGKGPIRANIECTDMWTYWTVRGQRGQGRGAIMSNDRSSEVVTAVSQGIGKMSESAKDLNFLAKVKNMFNYMI